MSQLIIVVRSLNWLAGCLKRTMLPHQLSKICYVPAAACGPHKFRLIYFAVALYVPDAAIGRYYAGRKTLRRIATVHLLLNSKNF
jgi:hypothetical protein